MATNGSPKEGIDNILINAYTGLQLILYTNTANSLDRDTVLADLVEPSALDDLSGANGYGAQTLSGVWSSTAAVISYDHGTPDAVRFTNTGSLGAWDTATGSAVTDGNFILHFKDFATARGLVIGASLDVDISSLVG